MQNRAFLNDPPEERGQAFLLEKKAAGWKSAAD